MQHVNLFPFCLARDIMGGGASRQELFRLDINALSIFVTARLKTHVGGNKLKEKGKDAFSDGGDRYMHTFTEDGFSGEVDLHAY